jgi:hypothetical protein
VLVDLDVVIEPDPALLPFGKNVGFGRQRLKSRLLQILEQRTTAGAEMARRAIVDLRDQLGDGRNAESEKNCWLRSLAMMKRVATCTATSTLALSRARYGRAGTMAVL